MSDTCDVDGCEDDARVVVKHHDEAHPVISGKQFCLKHIDQVLVEEDTDE